MIKWKSVLGKWTYFAITSLLVVAPALYNRYPMVYFDSGAYMEMAANLLPSFHRAFGYPLLIKFTGFMASNWPLIVLQGLLVSLLLYALLREILPSRSIWKAHFLSLMVLVFGSALPWYASQLMPDVWTFILVLTFAVIVLSSTLSPIRLGLFLLLLLLSILTHLSHFPLLALLAVSVWLMAYLSPAMFVIGVKKRMYAVGAVLAVSFIITSSFNAIHGFGFRLSLASNVFITANLAEMGILQLYLDEQCASKGYDLCSLGDDLPIETGGFLWDAEGPVMTHQGGWAGADSAYAPIVHDVLTQPRYLKWFLFSGAKATFKQMFQIELGSGLQYKYGVGSPPYWPMKTHFQQELNEYLNSVQNKGDDLPIGFFRWLNYITLFFSIAIIGWAFLSNKLSTKLLAFLVVVFLAYFFNAAITGVLANVYERLQVRLLPLVQFMAVLVLITEVPQIRKLLDKER